MILVSSLFEYSTSIPKGPQRAKSQHTNIKDGEEPGATYELMDGARQDPRLTAASPTDVNSRSLRNEATTDERAASGHTTPQSDGGKETGGQTPAESKRRRKHKYKVLFGLALPFALQSLDTTIIASALPFIAADFGTLIRRSAVT